MHLQVETFGYALCAIVYIALILTLTIRKHHTFHYKYFLASSIAMLIWSLANTLLLTLGYKNILLTLFLEGLRVSACLLLLLDILRTVSKQSRDKETAKYSWLTYIFCLLACIINPFLLNSQLLWTDSDSLKRIALFTSIYSTYIFCLILLVNIFVQYTYKMPKFVNYLCGMYAIMLAYDFFMYVQSFLTIQPFGETHLHHSRGLIFALLAIPICIATINQRKELKFSHQLTFKMSITLLIGIYLGAILAIGYQLGRINGNAATGLQTAFLISATLLLIVLMLSKSLRDKTRVTVSRHLFNYKYDYRDEWTRITKELSSDQDIPLPERVIRCLAETVKSTGGGLWLKELDGKTYVQQASYNMEHTEYSDEDFDSSLIRFFKEKEWVIDLEERALKPLLYNNLQLPDWLKRQDQAWLIVPLILQQDLLGFVIINKPWTAIDINWEDRDLLKVAGRQAASFLQQMKTSEALIEARQFQAYNRASAFIIHDLKTLISQFTLLTSNYQRHKSNPVFIEDMFSTVEHSVTKMDYLLTQLKKGESNNSSKDVDISYVIQQVVKERSSIQPPPKLVRLESPIQIFADSHKLYSMLTNLIENAQHATPNHGYVHVSLHRQHGWLKIKVSDNGCGMGKEYINEKLFKPFESTKGLTGMGIGMYQIKEYLKHLGGNIQVLSQVNIGTEFIVSIPLSNKEVSYLEAKNGTG